MLTNIQTYFKNLAALSLFGRFFNITNGGVKKIQKLAILIATQKNLAIAIATNMEKTIFCSTLFFL